MRALLDVNVLLALFDTRHVHHTRAQRWWLAEQEHGWASCPLTENGFLRIVSQKSYPNPWPLADALLMLRTWAQPPRHEFWSDSVSLLDTALIDHTRILSPRQLTDVYLFALAVNNDGRLVTFDTGISHKAVRGAKPSQLVVV